MNRKQLIIFYTLIVLLMAMFFINYKIYQENDNLKIRIGTEYNYLITKSLSLLNEESSIEYWLDSIESPQGKESLQHFINQINYLSISLERNNMSEISTQMDLLEEQFRELKNKEKELSEESIKELELNISILTSLLTNLKLDLEDNPHTWYKEINYDSSKTHEYIKKELESQRMNLK